MESAVSTFFVALPIAVVVMYFMSSVREQVISILAILGIIIGVLFFFIDIFVFVRAFVEPTITWGGIFEWAYICLTALVPTVIFIGFITFVDRKKPEPLKALLIAVLMGILAAFSVAGIGSQLFIGGLESDMAKNLNEAFSIGFLKIAIPSEVIKWLFLLVFLGLNKYYDEYLDGIVYSVCLSMGFAGVLGLWYMSTFWGFFSSEILTKGVTASLILIPIHLMSGAAMGYLIAIVREKRWFLKIPNIIGALIVAILIDGLICSMLAMMGGYVKYYPIIVVLLLILSVVFYWQITHLKRLDA